VVVMMMVWKICKISEKNAKYGKCGNRTPTFRVFRLQLDGGGH